MLDKLLRFAWERARPALRWYVLSYEALIVTWALVLAAHVQWGTLTDDAGRGEAVSAFGAWTTIFGIAVAARPYVRAGREGMYAAARPRPPGAFVITTERSKKFRERVEATEPERRRDVDAERIWTVLVVVAGTLINGYGAPIGRLLSFAG